MRLQLVLRMSQIVAFVMARGPSGVDCTLAGVQGLGAPPPPSVGVVSPAFGQPTARTESRVE